MADDKPNVEVKGLPLEPVAPVAVRHDEPAAAPDPLARSKAVLSKQLSDVRGRMGRREQEQADLAKEESRLKDVRAQQDRYDRDRDRLLADIEKALAMVEKRAAQAAELTETLSVARRRFRQSLTSLRTSRACASSRDPSADLTRASAELDAMRKEFAQLLAQISAITGKVGPAFASAKACPLPEATSPTPRWPRPITTASSVSSI